MRECFLQWLAKVALVGEMGAEPFLNSQQIDKSAAAVTKSCIFKCRLQICTLANWNCGGMLPRQCVSAQAEQGRLT